MSISPAELYIAATAASVIERIDVAPRAERLLATPSPFDTGPGGKWLATTLGASTSLWRHQALGLQALVEGHHLVVSTGTASGKSLIFMAPAIREMFEGNGTVLILYPQKALGGDQFHRIERALMDAGLDPGMVGEINGDIPMAERDCVLAERRIILATPDVIHSWLMRQLGSPAVQAFLSRLRYLVIDEAHVFEGVFGSNGAYFFRRLRAAHAMACEQSQSPSTGLQLIATTATLAEPAKHLEALTGCRFATVTEEDNGSPFHGLTLLHVDGPAHGGPAERMAADIGTALAPVIGPNAFILFNDSRQGVERITATIERPDVQPYRGGYRNDDRRSIEKSLRGKQLSGVVSTSALELGIDIPQFTIGVNMGVPQTRKQFRQRAGRIGRSSHGAFVVIAPPTAFRQLGSSFREFLEGNVEPSPLYLANRFIQFQQASCFVEEAGDDLQRSLQHVDWPAGFGAILESCLNGAQRPKDLEHVASLGSDCPQLAFPLRNICETNFALRSRRNASEILGHIELDKALREAYPGAIYRHFRQAHRVVEWRSTSYERSIILEPIKNAQPTQPLLRTSVNVSTGPGELIDRRLLTSDRGTMAEVAIRVTDSVEGYRVGSTVLPYRELQKTNRNMRRRSREFGTTGVLIRIDEPWFAGDGDASIKARHAVMEALKAILAREHSLAPAELRGAHVNIATCGSGGARLVHDAIVIFDDVTGGLRLSAPLFTEFPALLDRLDRAAELSGPEALLESATVGKLRDWFASLAQANASPDTGPNAMPGELMIFAPKSEVAVRIKGDLVERTLLEPQILTMGEADVLMYRYETGSSAHGWVAHDQIETIGHNWRRALWNPISNAIRAVDQ